VSDLPLVPLLADRPASLATADPSFVRVSTGSLRRREIVLASRGAGAAVVGRSFATVPGLRPRLGSIFEHTVRVDGVLVYLR
jgi:hypothetical protein